MPPGARVLRQTSAGSFAVPASSDGSTSSDRDLVAMGDIDVRLIVILVRHPAVHGEVNRRAHSRTPHQNVFALEGDQRMLAQPPSELLGRPWSDCNREVSLVSVIELRVQEGLIALNAGGLHLHGECALHTGRGGIGRQKDRLTRLDPRAFGARSLRGEGRAGTPTEQGECQRNQQEQLLHVASSFFGKSTPRQADCGPRRSRDVPS